MIFKAPVSTMETKKVKIGEIYEFIYNIKVKVFGLEKKFVQYIVEGQNNFKVIDIYYNNNQLVVIAEVIKNPLPFLVVFGIIVAGSSIVLTALGLSLVQVNKVIEQPAFNILSITLLLVVIIYGYKLIT